MRRTTKAVVRVEAEGEAAVSFPSLHEAMRLAPRHPEAFIATSLEGVHLADAMPVAGTGSVLAWQLTFAGRDVDGACWTTEAPTLSEFELDTALMRALGRELAPSGWSS